MRGNSTPTVEDLPRWRSACARRRRWWRDAGGPRRGRAARRPVAQIVEARRSWDSGRSRSPARRRARTRWRSATDRTRSTENRARRRRAASIGITRISVPSSGRQPNSCCEVAELQQHARHVHRRRRQQPHQVALGGDEVVQHRREADVDRAEPSRRADVGQRVRHDLAAGGRTRRRSRRWWRGPRPGAGAPRARAPITPSRSVSPIGDSTSSSVSRSSVGRAASINARIRPCQATTWVLAVFLLSTALRVERTACATTGRCRTAPCRRRARR
jgi:hypothetical protein